MKPICVFAIFAREHEVEPRHLNLKGIYGEFRALSLEQKEGIMWHDTTLYVSLIADEGHHDITITHRGTSFVLAGEFEILPEHAFQFLYCPKTQFPIIMKQEPIINEYPILLDGSPLATAHLISYLM